MNLLNMIHMVILLDLCSMSPTDGSKLASSAKNIQDWHWPRWRHQQIWKWQVPSSFAGKTITGTRRSIQHVCKNSVGLFVEPHLPVRGILYWRPTTTFLGWKEVTFVDLIYLITFYSCPSLMPAIRWLSLYPCPVSTLWKRCWLGLDECACLLH